MQVEKSSSSIEVQNNIDFLEEEVTENLPLLLIVEDNAEIRKLIRQQFELDYNIKEAENGKKGIQIALEIVPDIIISDIMMPETDGIELTKQVKNDERTSHIPIILLTAKAGEENELIGLKNKADDYILKPFSPENLRVRVQNLIELRKKLRERYSQEVILRPKDIAISTHDEVFLEKVQILLDEKLTESEFTSEYFSIEIGMSRMQLHRKLKALVGLSTTEFIRSQRLKMATHILLNSDINISEVAYEVGFNDPSYFTKCFKASYGISPGNYAKAQLQK
jgi:YesN/AraC family two-component response regulator